MGEYMGYVLLAIIAFFGLKYFFRKSSSSPASKKQTARKEAAPSTPPSTQDTRPFEEKWKTGPLRCDGWLCNSEHRCNKPERLMCRDVVSKVIPNGYFKGQFEINLPSKDRRVDFAIETQEGKHIVVELDGYDAHVKVDKEKFQDGLLRQNELICNGWIVLRFSFFQVLNDAAQCRELLRAAMNPSIVEGFSVHKAKGLCPRAGCKGEAYRRRNKQTGELFWKCTKCEQTFDHDMVTCTPRIAA